MSCTKVYACQIEADLRLFFGHFYKYLLLLNDHRKVDTYGKSLACYKNFLSTKRKMWQLFLCQQKSCQIVIYYVFPCVQHE